MIISDILRKLRQKLELTQEELAEKIGVSGQAVSKWERNECYPDITLLPGLADIFEVSVDELLGVKTEEKNEKLNDIYVQSHTLASQKKFNEAYELIQSAQKIFPVEMMGCMAMTFSLDNSSKNITEAITLYERLLNENISNKLRGTVLAALCHLYKK